MSRRDYLKYLGFQVAIAQLHIKELKQPLQMTPNDKLPETTQERIKADAIRTYPIPVKFSDQVACMERRDGYLAGATAENERLQPVIDALDQFISYHESGLLPARHVYEKAVTARKQWRDEKKEVCTCDNIQLAAHGECWGCPGRDTREKGVENV